MAYEFKLPDIGEGLTEAEVVRWLVQAGGEVQLDGPLVEVETDKAVVEIPAPKAGVLLHQGAGEGETLKVGDVLAVIGAAGEVWMAGGEAQPIVGTLLEPEELDAAPPPGPQPGRRVEALPVVRKLARERGVDLTSVTGTGPGGRITREDVLAAAGAVAAAPVAAQPGEGEERVRLSKLRRTIAEHMTRSWREIPHVTTYADAEAPRLMSARRALADQRGGTFPLEALLIAAVVPALREMPEFNATLDGDDLILKRHYDIGVAVDTPGGLIVPVVRRADALDVSALAGEVTRLTEAAKARTLTPDELTGGTFTLSNIGAIGGGYGTPIIPYGTTAILSVGRAEERPVARDGGIYVTRLLPLSLSFDHRVIDGAMGRRFIAAVVDNLEEPARFM